VIKVAKDNLDTLVLAAQQVLNGNLDVIESDVGGSRSWRVRGLDGLCLDSLAPLDKEDAKALVGLNTSDEVVAVDTVRDPFLGAVDDLEETRVSKMW
jgi:hypothetical protein